jgi:hypothetical protein
MKNHILVGTHHKTGTVWMLRVFRQIARALEIPMYELNPRHGYLDMKSKRARIDEVLEKGVPTILFDEHSEFPLEGNPYGMMRGIHIIRDPRDVIISAAKFHSWSDEAWLHEPRPEFDGLTYADKINSVDDQHQKLIFEMDNASGPVIRAIDTFDSQDIFENVKYESLITDTDLYLWHRLSVFLGFEGPEIMISMKKFWNNALFGGADTNRPHIQDGSVKQFEDIFDEPLAAEFDKRFEGVLERLEYVDGEGKEISF